MNWKRFERNLSGPDRCTAFRFALMNLDGPVSRLEFEPSASWIQTYTTLLGSERFDFALFNIIFADGRTDVPIALRIYIQLLRSSTFCHIQSSVFEVPRSCLTKAKICLDKF
jgi:hypothetical protein